MITVNKQNISVVAGETDTVLRDGLFNDSADNATGNTVKSGTWLFADGTNGGLIFIRITNAGGGVITQIEVQAIANGLAKTIYTFPGLMLSAAGLYVFEVQPASNPGNFDGQIQGAMPNTGQLLITLSAKTPDLGGNVSIQSTW
jgi:hypothetical protein